MKKIDWDQAATLMSPHPYALVSSVSADGRTNLMGLGWYTFTSWEPRILAISVGMPRRTRENLDAVPEFVLCLPNVDQSRGAWLCGSVSGHDVDKFAEAGFEAVASSVVRPPRIRDATVTLECRVVQRVESGDHVVYFGEVLAMHGSPEHRMHLYTLHYSKPVGIDCDLNVRRHVEHE
jgi:flavin reductase (DIM6/NTAB) family NADH-FMN oxidoreductase RutF